MAKKKISKKSATTARYPTYVKRVAGKGWGAFCTKKIPAKAVFSISPLLVLSGREARIMSESSLEAYWYQFGTKGRALALGLGSIMNHSDEPNCSYHFSKRNKTLSFFALRDIPAHEELTHDYGWASAAYEAYGITRNLPKKKRSRR